MISYCTSCEHAGTPEIVTPGSFVIEVLLWLCFLVPGLIYSVWRWSSRYPACPVCKSREIVPENSPLAQKKIAADPGLQRTVVASRQMSFHQSLLWLVIFTLIAIAIIFVAR